MYADDVNGEIAVAVISGEQADDVQAVKPQPFVKWVGGKRSLMNELLAHLPEQSNRYWEPFAGGGALFFEWGRTQATATLSDMNVELVLTYRTVRDHIEPLLERLREHDANHSSDYYYEQRSREPTCAVELAAWFLYTNKTGYNGLFRVNKRNGFNVPFGKNPSANIVQERNLRACNRALQNFEVMYCSYNDIAPATGDFVYFDPPYHPTTETSFLKYSSDGFSEKDQQNLAEFAGRLVRRGVKVMLSNSDTRFIRELYKSKLFNVNSVSAPRMVNCKPGGRGHAAEVLITSY